MGDFYTDAIVRTARKPHKCTYCAEGIAAAEKYVFQKGNYDGHWFESKMHPECFDDLATSGEGDYLPYYNERPKKDGVP